MADYSIISDVSNMILRVLRQELSPEPIQSQEAIALASPNDKNGDFQLGVFLYDVKELSEYRSSAPIRGTNNTKRYPDKPLTLSYMLFVNARAQIAAGAETEQRIFGRSIQALMDHPHVDLSTAQPIAPNEGETASVTILNPSFEDKNRIWSALNLPYQVAVHFSVSPVTISSRHEIEFTRVVETEITTQQIPQKTT